MMRAMLPTLLCAMMGENIVTAAGSGDDASGDSASGDAPLALNNSALQCWWECGEQTGSCSFCGAEGACCRASEGYGLSNEECGYGLGGCEDNHCCVLPFRNETALNHTQDECWWDCDEKGGACPSFCGSRGACCKQGEDLFNAACGFGSRGCNNNHCCVLESTSPAPPAPPSTPVPLNVTNRLEQCWWNCGEQGGECSSFCGDSGACCRNGDDTSNAACGNGTLGCTDKHCCVLSATVAANTNQIENEDDQCWWSCDERGGACPSFCGTEGACCRRGVEYGGTNSAACAYTALGSTDEHRCTLRADYSSGANPLHDIQGRILALPAYEQKAVRLWLATVSSAQ